MHVYQDPVTKKWMCRLQHEPGRPVIATDTFETMLAFLRRYGLRVKPDGGLTDLKNEESEATNDLMGH